MNATAAADRHNKDIYSGHMRKPAIISAALHIFVFILATVGLPRLAKPPEVQEIAITVELADLAELNQTNVLEKPQQSELQEPVPPAKPVYNSSESVPDLLSPREPEPETADVPMPPDEKTKADPTVIKDPPKPKNKPKPKPKAQPQMDKPKEEEKKEDKQDFTSLLKSLTPEQPDDQAEAQQNIETGAGQTSQVADYSKDLTRNEMADLNAGVAPCWNVNAGGKFAEELKVTLRVFINQQMRVTDVQILDQLRYSTDSHFRAAADTARRALLNPQCSTLRIPPEKYEDWKVFKYHFDPSQML